MFRIIKIDSIEEFRKYKNVWNDIENNDKRYTPWVSWEWHDKFIKYFLGNGELFILLVYKGNDLLAICPFMKIINKYKWLFKCKTIKYMGNMHSQVCNIIFSSSGREDKKLIANKIAKYFLEEYRDWDIIDLEMIPEEEEYYGLFSDAGKKCKLKLLIRNMKGDWYLDKINYPFSEYYGNLSRKRRKDILRCKRNMEGKGKVAFFVRRDGNELNCYLDMYSKIRSKSWKGEEKDSEYLRECTKMMSEKGWLRLAFLFINNKPIACEKWVVWNGIAYGWDGIYDLEYSKDSPGTIINKEIIEYMIDEEKVSEIDMGIGDDEYKKIWAPKRRERRQLVIYNRHLRGVIYYSVGSKIIPVFKENRLLALLKQKISEYLKNKDAKNE